MKPECLPQMPCRACGGTGRVCLPVELLNTLDIVRARGAITAPELDTVCGVGRSPTAANNRLEDLRMLGYLVRRKEGRRWRYSLAQAAVKADLAPKPRRLA